MIAYPLDEPHLEALRWACRVRLQYGTDSVDGPASRAAALRALSSPASAASLVRDLLARAGFTVSFGDAGHEFDGFWWSTSDNSTDYLFIATGWPKSPAYRPVQMPDVPRLIFALASLAPGDREGALKALREVGR